MGKVRYIVSDPQLATDDGGRLVGPYSYVEGDEAAGPGQPNETTSPETWWDWVQTVGAPFRVAHLPETVSGMYNAVKNAFTTQDTILKGGDVGPQGGQAAAVLSAFTPVGTLAARGIGKTASAAGRGERAASETSGARLHANHEDMAPVSALLHGVDRDVLYANSEKAAPFLTALTGEAADYMAPMRNAFDFPDQMPKEAFSKLDMTPEAREARAAEQGYVPFYHGTTHEIDPTKGFKDPKNPENVATELGLPGYSVESYDGAGIYGSSSPFDATKNYAGRGPDLTSRIDEAVSSGHNPMALDGGRADTLDMRARLKNPVYTNATDEIERYGLSGHSRVRRKAPEGRVTKWDYSDGYDPDLDVYGDPTGSAVDIINAVERQLTELGISKPQVRRTIAELNEKAVENEGLRATDLDQMFREGDIAGHLLDENMGAGQFLQNVYRAAGHDGIVRANADFTFRGMGMDPGTTHMTIWNPEQLRFAGAAFDPEMASSSNLLSANNGKAAPFSLVAAGSGATEKGFKPETYFHGSKNIRDLVESGAFDPSKLDDSHSIFGAGAFATTSPRIASSHAWNGNGNEYRGGLRFEHDDNSGVMPLKHRLENPLDMRDGLPFSKIEPIVGSVIDQSRGMPLLGPKPYDTAMRMLDKAEASGSYKDADLLFGNLSHAYDGSLVRKAIQGEGHDGVLHTGGKIEGMPHEVMMAFPNALHKLRSPNAKFEDLDVNNLFAANAPTVYPFAAVTTDDRQQ